MQNLSRKWLSIQMTHETSAAATDAFWTLSMEMMPKLFQLKEDQNIRTKIPAFTQQRIKMASTLCPTIYVNHVYKDTENGAIITISDSNEGNYKKNARYEKLYEEAHVKVR